MIRRNKNTMPGRLPLLTVLALGHAAGARGASPGGAPSSEHAVPLIDLAPCLTAKQCRRKFAALKSAGAIGGFYYISSNYSSKGCFLKRNNVYFGTGGTAAAMSKSDLPGVQERIWCDADEVDREIALAKAEEELSLIDSNGRPEASNPAVDASAEGPAAAPVASKSPEQSTGNDELSLSDLTDRPVAKPPKQPTASPVAYGSPTLGWDNSDEGSFGDPLLLDLSGPEADETNSADAATVAATAAAPTSATTTAGSGFANSGPAGPSSGSANSAGSGSDAANSGSGSAASTGSGSAGFAGSGGSGGLGSGSGYVESVSDSHSVDSSSSPDGSGSGLGSASSGPHSGSAGSGLSEETGEEVGRGIAPVGDSAPTASPGDLTGDVDHVIVASQETGEDVIGAETTALGHEPSASPATSPPLPPSSYNGTLSVEADFLVSNDRYVPTDQEFKEPVSNMIFVAVGAIVALAAIAALWTARRKGCRKENGSDDVVCTERNDNGFDGADGVEVSLAEDNTMPGSQGMVVVSDIGQEDQHQYDTLSRTVTTETESTPIISNVTNWLMRSFTSESDATPVVSNVSRVRARAASSKNLMDETIEECDEENVSEGGGAPAQPRENFGFFRDGVANFAR